MNSTPGSTDLARIILPERSNGSGFPIERRTLTRRIGQHVPATSSIQPAQSALRRIPPSWAALGVRSLRGGLQANGCRSPQEKWQPLVDRRCRQRHGHPVPVARQTEFQDILRRRCDRRAIAGQRRICEIRHKGLSSPRHGQWLDVGDLRDGPRVRGSRSVSGACGQAGPKPGNRAQGDVPGQSATRNQ